MHPKPSSWFNLSDPDLRKQAHLAGQARLDTLFGGCSALINCGDDRDLLDTVSNIYSASTGRHSLQYEAWECGECGTAHMGWQAAAECCTEQEPDERWACSECDTLHDTYRDSLDCCDSRD